MPCWTKTGSYMSHLVQLAIGGQNVYAGESGTALVFYGNHLGSKYVLRDFLSTGTIQC